MSRIVLIAMLIPAVVAIAQIEAVPATQPAATTTQPAVTQPAATQPAEVPQELLSQIEQQFELPEQPMSPQQAVTLLRQRMQNVLDLGRRAQRQYPDAPNMHIVRDQMLQAASFIASQGDAADAQRTLADIASQIMASDVEPALKVEADAQLTRQRLAAAPADQHADIISEYVGRYRDDRQAEPAVLVFAGILANQTNQRQLQGELIATMRDKYIDHPRVRSFLRRVGERPDIGRPFEARLPKLDGGELVLPDDLKGKVVIVDFWASWCGPCRADMPKVRQIYNRYKDQYLEIVGVSLDEDREAMMQFVREMQMNWVQTFSGKGWSDPTVQAYDIAGVPSVWVLDRDGKVISDDARANLEQVVVEALKKPQTSPAATEPAAAEQ